MTRLFPTLIIVLSAAASVVCGCRGEWGRCAYWFGAALVNFAATYLF